MGQGVVSVAVEFVFKQGVSERVALKGFAIEVFQTGLHVHHCLGQSGIRECGVNHHILHLNPGLGL